MIGDVVYMKTAKGLEEIEQRSCNLPRRLRSALIMIDGRTPENLLRERFLALGDPDWIIECLLSDGFIRLSHPVDILLINGAKQSTGQISEDEPVPVVSTSIVRNFKCALNLNRCTGGDCVMSRGCLKFNSIK